MRNTYHSTLIILTYVSFAFLYAHTRTHARTHTHMHAHTQSLAVIPVQWKDWLLLLCCLSRVALIPLLLLSVSPSPTHPTVKSLVYAGVLVSLLGVTGGYFGTMAMVLAPGQVPRVAREVAGW